MSASPDEVSAPSEERTHLLDRLQPDEERDLPPVVCDAQSAPEGPPWHYDLSDEERAAREEKRETRQEKRDRLKQKALDKTPDKLRNPSDLQVRFRTGVIYTAATVICVLAGNNEKLKNILKKNFADRKDVRVIPFTTEVNKYMASADVILTKPGGLTSTEAAAMRVPLVHTEPIPGCETCNSVFFSERGISVTAVNAKQAAEKAIMLCREQTARLDMKNAQQQHIDPFAVSKICSYVKKESEERVNA